MTKKVRITNADGEPYDVVVKRSDGSVEVLSNPGDGADFTLSAGVSLTITERARAKPEATEAGTIGPRTPAEISLFQTPNSLRTFGDGTWLYCNTQLQRKDHGLSDEAVARIMLNCGCDAEGNWHDASGNPTPAFGRGFEQADTPAEQQRLRRYNATPRVMDVKWNPILGRWQLDETRHVALVAQIPPAGRNPPVYAVRALNEAALNEWIDFMGASRANPGA